MTVAKKNDLQPDKVLYLLKLLRDIPESIPPKQFEEYIELQKSQMKRSTLPSRRKERL
jgi:hypothetical protein